MKHSEFLVVFSYFIIFFTDLSNYFNIFDCAKKYLDKFYFVLFPMALHKNHEVDESTSYKAIYYEFVKRIV